RAVAGERTFSSRELAAGVVLLLGRRVVLLLHHRPHPVQHRNISERWGLVGASAGIEKVHRSIARLGPLEVPVLLRGETGTGKELVARALHDASPRRERPFVAVNMAVLGPSLAAAALFGAERGAYTGADRTRTGLFQSAHGGTLFLDEVGDTPPEVQAMLLRALETREVHPVGSSGGGIEVDVRVLAATDARLERAIEEDRFKAALFYRLAGSAIDLPALRDRREDFGRLLYLFLGEALGQLGERAEELPADRAWPPAEWVARLALHRWPGNVRELRNVAHQLAIAGPDEPFPDLASLGLGLSLGSLSQGSLDPEAADDGSSTLVPLSGILRELPGPSATARQALRKLSDVGEEELLAALRKNRWHIRHSAEALGISRPNLYRLMEACPSIRTAQQLEREEIEQAVAASPGDLGAAALHLEVSLLGLKRRMTSLGMTRG
ncbi:MAG: sigma 54-interacting transcriptional regulator, partial [Acidobacteriota bacterium]